jgi:DUF1680 family protein
MKQGVFSLNVAIMACLGILAQAKDYPIQPVPFTSVNFTDRFWAPRMVTLYKETIPHLFRMCDENGRMKSLAQAAGTLGGVYANSFVFDDSDLFKCVEAAAYVYARHPDDQNLKNLLKDTIALIAAAQEPDGYLYSCRTAHAETGDLYWKNQMGPSRWSNITGLSHELYNVGHLYEAAVAYYQATGLTDRHLLEVAIKNADLLVKTFNPAGIRMPTDHQEPELALVKLYRQTCKPEYLSLARFFLDERGYYHNGRPSMGTYGQDHIPVVQQTEAVGHCVRAAYMYSAMMDISALTDNLSYANAVSKIWTDVVGKKLFITGGIGIPSGEGFGTPYELPNESAYCETCASVANVLWNHRMFLFYGDAKYIDVMERTLYNSALAGINLNGNKFFYNNPLEVSSGTFSRQFWMGCACCPPNISRLLGQVAGWVYAQKNDQIYVNLYAGGSATISLPRTSVSLVQQTDYPWKGQVQITVNPVSSGQFTVHLRIPGWAQNQPVPSDLYRYLDTHSQTVTLAVNGDPVPLTIVNGYVDVNRIWKPGDMIELNFPMPVRRAVAHVNVMEDAGKVALLRGPVVYCMEGIDNQDKTLKIVIPDEASLTAEHHPDLLNGITVIKAEVLAAWKGDPVLGPNAVVTESHPLLAIPYYAWNNRGPSQMTVWRPRTVKTHLEGAMGKTIFLIDEANLSDGGKILDYGDTPWVDGALSGGGSIVSDSGGNGKPASKVLSLNGGDIRCGMANKTNLTGPLTVSVWFKTSDPGYWATLVGRGNPTDVYDAAWHIMIPGNVRFEMNYVGNVYTTRNLVDNQWHHIAGVYDKSASKVRIYLDGVLDNEASANGGNVGTSSKYITTIGSLARFQQFSGAIDEVGVWNRALGAAEIAEIYKNGIQPDVAFKHKPALRQTVNSGLTALTWKNGRGATACSVMWFGTDPLNSTPDILVNRQMVETAAAPSPLGSAKTYYWRVDCVDAWGMLSEGRMMSFKVN